jgi:hypothetical protein
MKSLRFLNIVLGTLLLCALATQVQAKDKEKPLEYSIQSAGSANQGYYLVEVSAMVDKAKQVSEDIVLKCAVHGVLFRGFAAAQGGTAQRPLTGSAMQEMQHKEFYDAFFQNGSYKSYATFVNGSMKTTRVGKQFKVTGIVSVAKEQLRRDLEKAGMIKGLSSGF